MWNVKHQTMEERLRKGSYRQSYYIADYYPDCGATKPKAHRGMTKEEFRTRWLIDHGKI